MAYRGSGLKLEAQKMFVYLAMPSLAVYLYNHPTFHPYFARHKPEIVVPDAEDDSFERAMLSGPKYKTQLAEYEKQKAEEKRLKAAEAAAEAQQSKE